MLDYIVENDIGYQCNSKNQSFVDFCLRLKKRGINNWAFPLRLNDPKLVGVDPHNPKNQIEKNRVIIECAENPWYFFREVLRISESDECDNYHGVFKANRGNMAVLFDALTHDISSWITGPRQITGKTTTWVSAILWWYMFSITKRNIIIPVQTDLIMHDIIRRMNRILYNLPDYVVSYSMHYDTIEERHHEEREKKYDTYVFENPINGSMLSFIVPRGECETGSLLEIIKKVNASKMHCIIAMDDMECNTIGSRVMDALYGEGRRTQCLVTSVPCKSNECDALEDVYERDEILYDRTHAELKTIAGKLPLSVIHTEVDYRMLGKTEKWLECQASNIDEPLVCYRELLCGRYDDIYFSEDCALLMVKPDPRVFHTPTPVGTDLESVLLINKGVVVDATVENIYGLSESYVDLVVDLPNNEDADACGHYFAVSRDSGKILTDYRLPEIDYLLSHPAIPDVMWDKYGRTYYIASRHETYRMCVGDQAANK